MTEFAPEPVPIPAPPPDVEGSAPSPDPLPTPAAAPAPADLPAVDVAATPPLPVGAMELPDPPLPMPTEPPPPPLTGHARLVALARDAQPGDVLEDDPQKVYTVGVWGPVGAMRPNYRCRLCPFATLNGPDIFMAHFKARHLEEEEEAPPPSGLVGPNGRPL